jgi:hypothetical protein
MSDTISNSDPAALHSAVLPTAPGTPGNEPGLSGAAPAFRQLVPLDSPEMKYALQLCQEVYPGSRVETEVMADPDEPCRTWYSLNIVWPGDIREMLSRDLRWHEQFAAKYPQAANDFCLSSLPE